MYSSIKDTTFVRPRRRASIYERKSSVEKGGSRGRGELGKISMSKRASQFETHGRYRRSNAAATEEMRSEKDRGRENFESSLATVIFGSDSEVSSDENDARYIFNGLDSDTSTNSDAEDEEIHKKSKKKGPEIVLNVTVDDGHADGLQPSFKVPCGNGANTFRWLSTVAMTRYNAQAKSHGRLRLLEPAHVRPGSFNPSGVAGQTVMWPPSKYIGPQMRIADVLENGDDCTITLDVTGAPQCSVDGRQYSRASLEDVRDTFYGDAFFNSERAKSRHAKRKNNMEKKKKKKRETMMAKAAEEFFGIPGQRRNIDGTVVKSAMDAANAHTARQRKEELLFLEDWKKMSFHGQIRRSQIEPIKLIFRTNFQYLYAVFKKFACMGTDAVFRKATKAMRNLLGADRGTLWLANFEQGVLISKVAEKTGVIKVPMGAGIVGAVFDSGKAVNMKNAYDDHRFNRDVDVATGYRTVSLLTVPTLDVEGNPNGALQVVNKLNPEYDQNALADETKGTGKSKNKATAEKFIPFSAHDVSNLITLGHQVGNELEALMASSNSEDTMSEMSYVEFAQFVSEAKILGFVELDDLKHKFNEMAKLCEQEINANKSRAAYTEQKEVLRHHFFMLLVYLSKKVYADDYPEDASQQLKHLISSKIFPLVKSSMSRDVRGQMLLPANATVLLQNIEIFKKLFRLNACTIDHGDGGTHKGIKIKNLLTVVKHLHVYKDCFSRETVRAMFFLYQEDLDEVDTKSDEKLLSDANVDFGQFLMIMCEVADRGFGGETEMLAKKLNMLVYRIKKQLLEKHHQK